MFHTLCWPLLFSHSVRDPNMTHCLRQQPLAQTERTPHLQKPELPGSSLSSFFNLSARSYIQADTGFPLFGRCPQQRVVPVVWSNHTPCNSFHSRIVLPLQGTCCWYAEADTLSVWPNRCCRSRLTGHVGWDELGHARCQQRPLPCSEGHNMGRRLPNNI